MSAMAARLSASVITSHRQSCVLLAVGACMASWMHSKITSWLTGRFRSRRLRTDRVVVSNSSTDAMSTLSRPPSQTVVFTRSEIDRARLVDAEHGQRASQTKENRDTQCEIEDFLVGEDLMQPSEERVVDRCMVIRESLGELDGTTLPRGVPGVGGVGRDVLIQLRRDAGLEHRIRAEVRARDAVVDLRDPHPGQFAFVRRQNALLVSAADHSLDHVTELRPQRPNHCGLTTGAVGHIKPGHEASKPDVRRDCPGSGPWTGRDAEGYGPSERKRDAALAQEVSRHALHARGTHGAGTSRG